MGGDSVCILPPGLPNIVGKYYLSRSCTEVYGQSGAFSLTNATNASAPWSENNDNSALAVVFDASLSNKIYGKSDKVLPESFALIAQIKY